MGALSCVYAPQVPLKCPVCHFLKITPNIESSCSEYYA